MLWLFHFCRVRIGCEQVHIYLYFGYDITRSETGSIRVLSISDPHLAPFSDISVGHKISNSRIYIPLQLAQLPSLPKELYMSDLFFWSRGSKIAQITANVARIVGFSTSSTAWMATWFTSTPKDET
jgi:hypothetical protein